MSAPKKSARPRKAKCKHDWQPDLHVAYWMRCTKCKVGASETNAVARIRERLTKCENCGEPKHPTFASCADARTDARLTAVERRLDRIGDRLARINDDSRFSDH